MTTAPPTPSSGLLPEGLRDDLPPWAEHEATMTGRLMDCFAAHGYERIAPPLVEFEESLLAGPGASRAESMFRLLDPVSRKMMAVRADMTMQAARIATTRLAGRSRPLRLSYAGHVLRVKGSQLRPARQFRQAGVELIGASTPGADLEVVRLAAEALETLGIEGLTVDLVAPPLVPAVTESLGLAGATAEAARRALDAKDVGALAAFDTAARAILDGLMRASGPLERSLERLTALDLAPAPAAIRDRLVDFARRVGEALPGVAVTVDPGEFRGFEYHSGVGFAFFAERVRSELGRGGRYVVTGPEGGNGEEGVGFSMYLDSLLRAAPAPEPAPRLFLPFGTPETTAAAQRADGWRTVAGLEERSDARAEARRLGCSHIFESGRVVPLSDSKGR